MCHLGTENANGAQNQQKCKSYLYNEKHLILFNFSDVLVLLIFMQPVKHHDEPRRKISAPAYRPGRRDSVVAVHANRRASVAAPRRFNRRGSEVSISLDNLQDSKKTVDLENVHWDLFKPLMNSNAFHTISNNLLRLSRSRSN